MAQLYLLLLLAASAWAEVFEIEIPVKGSADLSGGRIPAGADTVRLVVRPANATGLDLGLLNVSGNPALQRVQVDGLALRRMQVTVLDLSGTAVVPGEEPLIHFVPADRDSVLLIIKHVFVNRTARPERPLPFANFAKLLYHLRAVIFALDNWPLSGFRADFTQLDNSCRSKNFNSVSIRRAGLDRIVGAAIYATQSVDFRHNRIALVANVTFHSSSVDLGYNRLSQLTNVSFLPGTYCQSLMTGLPEVRLNDNEVTVATLDAMTAAGPSVLSGLDLSRNPLVDAAQTSGTTKPLQRIPIEKWLRLESVVRPPPVTEGDNPEDDNSDGIERGLADLLSRFEVADPDKRLLRLDLSGNRLRSLAGAARVLRLAGLRPRNLRLAGNALPDHLNLSELLQPSGRLDFDSLDLGDLSGDPRRPRSLSVVMSRNATPGKAVDFDRLLEEWPARLVLQPRPAGCCAAQGTRQLFCFLRPGENLEYRRLLCGSSDGEASRAITADSVTGGHSGDGGVRAPTPPPLLLLLVLVGAAALAVVACGAAAIFAIRWRRSRRRRWRLRRASESPTAATAASASAAAEPLRIDAHRFSNGSQQLISFTSSFGSQEDPSPIPTLVSRVGVQLQ